MSTCWRDWLSYLGRGVPRVARPHSSSLPSHSASVIKTWFSMGGLVCAWRRRQWQHRDRNATRKGIPANADCRGGVFATRRFPRPPRHHAHPMPGAPSTHGAPRFLSRRGTPRRYVLRETGELGCKPPYSKRETAAKGQYGVKLLGGFSLLARNEVSIMQSHFSKSVVPYRDKDFYPLARLAIARLVGAVPSVASARPNQCSVAILSMSHRLRGACQGCNAERRESHA